MLDDSRVVYSESLPAPGELPEGALLIHDRLLTEVAPRELGAWLAGFPQRYPVAAGEGLKDVAALPGHLARLVELAAPLTARRPTVVAVGGGSVGDFAGFFASVFRRGVGLLHVPSTWLAALDSAHGGKNALNVGAVKNQIGTFYFPDRVYLVRSLLCAQPAERAREAFGELAKIALIDEGDEGGAAWVEALTGSPLTGGELLWRFLPAAVAAKYRVVRADPLERSGLRQHLNLGHTVGHVLETVHALPHGLAVAQGLRFALGFSARRGLLAAAEHDRICAWLERRFALPDALPGLARIAPQRFAEVLQKDKKRADAAAIRFVFLRGRGRVFTEAVDVAELVGEAARQGYLTA